MVCITPEAGTATHGLGGFQELDQLSVFSKITKYQGHVNRPDRIAHFAARCFDLALAEQGPVQLNIPRDFFHGEIDVVIPSPLRILPRLAGSAAALDAASVALTEANNPVIIARGGVIAKASQAVVARAEYLQAPVMTSYLHNDAFPAALGLKLKMPSRPVIADIGDGAWGMSLAETLTAVRETIPVVAVIFNNGQWGAEKKNQIDYYAGRCVATNLVNPSFAAVAQAMGARGLCIDQPDQVGDALREAVAINQPVIRECMLTSELGTLFGAMHSKSQ